MTVDVQATFAATLVDEWARAGVTHAVLAPGSRSTPLALALTADARIRTAVFLDERSAAFFAIGAGAATGRPAVVLTTSGTAAVELHPAVVEASQGGVPLLAVTADRPPELRDVGAPQTIDQTHLFGRAVRWFADPGPPDGIAPATWRSLAARAVAEARHGPVHLNLPFREPLVGDPGPLPEGRAGGRPWHEVGEDAAGRGAGVALDLPAHGVVVAGRGTPEGVLDLAAAAGWPVLADPLSGVRLPHGNVVAAFDAVLRTGRFAADVILRCGAPPASRVLAEWAAGPGADQIQVRVPPAWPDPHRTAGLVLDALPVVRTTPDGEWLESWRAAEAAAQGAIDAALAEAGGPTEPGLAREVVAAVPDGGRLVVSSSMPIRDVESYARPRAGLVVHANRGANGIDGVVSTALGVAASGDPTVALVGDLAFLHDAGGLLWAAGRDLDCTFVVVDNDGGGIFSFLPQAGVLEPDRFERLFGTPHGVDVAAVAAAYGVPTAGMDAVAAPGGVRLVHVRTDRRANVDVHRRINDAVARACP